jgi:hypothetical protein
MKVDKKKWDLETVTAFDYTLQMELKIEQV